MRYCMYAASSAQWLTKVIDYTVLHQTYQKRVACWLMFLAMNYTGPVLESIADNHAQEGIELWKEVMRKSLSRGTTLFGKEHQSSGCGEPVLNYLIEKIYGYDYAPVRQYCL